MTKPLDRQPVQAILLLLACAALYIYLLLLALGYQLRIPQPELLARLIADDKARFWAWDQLTHLLTVLAVSTPFAWLLSRLFGRRLALVGAVVVAPAVIWMVLDYFAMAGAAPDSPIALDLFYGLGVVEVAVALPLLSWLLRQPAATR
jgi:hypothetical protein